MITQQQAVAAVRTNPQDPNAWATLGDVMAQAGEGAKAREAYTKALALAPGHPGATAGLARLEAADLPAWVSAPEALDPGPTPPIAPWLAGAAPTPQATPSAPAPTTAPQASGVLARLWPLFVLGGLALLCYAVVASRPADPATPSDPNTGRKAAAVGACERYVKARLNNPATAEFPTFDYKVDINSDGTYRVLSRVTAQNAFGVPRQMQYICWVTPAGDTWTLQDLTLTEAP